MHSERDLWTIEKITRPDYGDTQDEKSIPGRGDYNTLSQNRFKHERGLTYKNGRVRKKKHQQKIPKGEEFSLEAGKAARAISGVGYGRRK